MTSIRAPVMLNRPLRTLANRWHEGVSSRFPSSKAKAHSSAPAPRVARVSNAELRRPDQMAVHVITALGRSSDGSAAVLMMSDEHISSPASCNPIMSPADMVLGHLLT